MESHQPLFGAEFRKNGPKINFSKSHSAFELNGQLQKSFNKKINTHIQKRFSI